VRLLRRLLPLLRRAGSGWSPAPYLALRRLTGASAAAMLLVGASAVSLGMLVYAGTLVRSTDVSADVKSRVAVGSDVAARLPSGTSRAEVDLPASTVVARGRALLQPGNVTVDLMAVDRTTFAEVAAWDARFADESLDALLSRLSAPDPDGRIPVLAAGGLPADGVMVRLGRLALPFHVAGTPEAFPGQRRLRPLLVVDRDVLEAAVAGQGAGYDPSRGLEQHLWARGEPAAMAAWLEARGWPADDITTVGDVRERPAVRSVGWALGYLQALGVLAGVLAFAATVLYLQERQQSREVSYVLARRMGLRRAVHRRAVRLELAGMLLVAFGLGSVLALGAAAAVVSRIELLPEYPPGPVTALPGGTLGWGAAAVGLACWVGAWLVQLLADHARAGEVLRAAE
jgi:putative ABC transport system permease protein